MCKQFILCNSISLSFKKCNTFSDGGGESSKVQLIQEQNVSKRCLLSFSLLFVELAKEFLPSNKE